MSLGWLVILVAAILVNSAFAGISQAIALLTRREATMIAVANFIGLPLLFLSSTMIARPQMPHWMQSRARLQPGRLGRAAPRARSCCRAPTGARSALHLGYLLALTAVTAAFATWTFRVVPALALSRAAARPIDADHLAGRDGAAAA